MLHEIKDSEIKRRTRKIGNSGGVHEVFITNFELGNQAQGHAQTRFHSISDTLELLLIRRIKCGVLKFGQRCSAKPGNMCQTIYSFNLH